MVKNKYDKGFTLVELAIALLIFSLIALILTQAFSHYHYALVINKTDKAIESSHAALVLHQALFEGLPCPSDITLPQNDPNSGVEDCSLSPVSFGRDTDSDGVPDNILIGGVPYKTLLERGINAENFIADSIYDGWGNKLLYVVTEKLTYDPLNFVPFDPFKGNIDIVDEYGETLLPKESTAHMLILSHGSNGRGAYKANGQLVKNCVLSITITNPTPVDPTMVIGSEPDETENCDNNDNRFLSALRSTEDNNYYDDIIRWSVVPPPSAWVFSNPLTLSGGGNIDRIVNTNPGNIGIGIDEPHQKIHVLGDLQANQVKAHNYCDINGLNCVPAELIAGNPDLGTGGLKCPKPTDAVVAIEGNKLICEPAFKKRLKESPGERLCTKPNEFVRGISNINGVICGKHK